MLVISITICEIRFAQYFITDIMSEPIALNMFIRSMYSKFESNKATVSPDVLGRFQQPVFRTIAY